MSIITELYGDFKFIIGYRTRVMKAQKKLNAQAPRVGNLAPDFTLTDSRGEETITLSQFRGQKPVVLIFGSFT